jgi:hypothetical protein
MAVTVSPTEQQIDTALNAFLATLAPAGTPIILGQQNRVPEPQPGTFLVMWPLRRIRLATNEDAFDDCFFDGSIAGTLMTVGTVTGLALAPGRAVYGPDVAAGTTIASQQSGTPGGAGVYVVSPSQTVSSATFSAGAATFTQETEVVYQVDVHAPGVQAASDLAQAITTMTRDAYATTFFAAQGVAVRPIHADDPRQIPWTDAEDQFESRYVVEMHLDVQQTISGVPAQFAGSATITAINVDASFPP